MLFPVITLLIVLDSEVDESLGVAGRLTHTLRRVTILGGLAHLDALHIDVSIVWKAFF